MTRKTVFIILILAMTALSVLSAPPAQMRDNEKPALAAAEKWLVLVDAGNSKDSWAEASSLFKDSVKPDQWAQTMNSVRKPLGKLVSRKASQLIHMTSFPGAPDGQYIVIHFNTSFENMKTAKEEVVMMMDKDGQWRVSGYHRS